MNFISDSVIIGTKKVKRKEEGAVSDYSVNREKLLELIKRDVTSPLVLFCQNSFGLGSTVLIATVRHPTREEKFLVLGSYRQFPGLDVHLARNVNWQLKLSEVMTWLTSMKEAAGEVKFAEDTTAVFLGDEPTAKWVTFIPGNKGFSNPERGWGIPKTTILAPEAEVMHFDVVTARLVKLEHLQGLDARRQTIVAEIAAATSTLAEIDRQKHQLEDELGL